VDIFLFEFLRQNYTLYSHKAQKRFVNQHFSSFCLVGNLLGVDKYVHVALTGMHSVQYDFLQINQFSKEFALQSSVKMLTLEL
jgi:hypothetical protein